ncbi:MAG: DUF697 domain-containing protein [Rhodospirillales bacterium]
MTDSVTDTVPDAEIPHPAEAAAATQAPADTAALDDEKQDAIDKALDANDVIKNHVIASMAVGLVPIPGVDLAGTLAVQVRMAHQICGIYGVTLRQNAVKTAVLSLLGSMMPVALAGGLISGLKAIPGLGTLSGAAGVSLLGGAMTYAIGSVFQQHLESHDSLIDFDPTKVKSVMRREFDAGLTVARTLRGKVSEAIIAKEKENAKAANPDLTEAAPTDAAPPDDSAKAAPSAIRREIDASVASVRSFGAKAAGVFKKSPAAQAEVEAVETVEAAPAAAEATEHAHTTSEVAAAKA